MMARGLRGAALVALLGSLSLGCPGYRDSRNLAIGGGVVLLTGATITAIGAATARGGPLDNAGVGIMMAGVFIDVPGLVIMSSGLVGMAMHSGDVDGTPPKTP